MVGGLRGMGVPDGLLNALAERGTGGLTLVCEVDSPAVLGLVSSGRLRKLVCPPINEASWTGVKASGIEVEPQPAGVLAERIRAAGAGIGSFLMPQPSQGPETGTVSQELDGRHYVVEAPLRADFALLRAYKADTLGNLIYQGAARNWNPTMAAAATVVIVEVDEVVEAGELDPEAVVTPGIFVDRIVCSQLPTGQ